MRGVVVGAFVIVLREGFEASLVLGIVFAFLNEPDSERGTVGLYGMARRPLGLSVVMGAVLFATVGELEGTAEQLFEGVAMLLAAVVLTWMVFWMRKQARTIGGALRAQVGDAVASGGGLALALVAFVAVAREGLESALFLFVSVGDNGLAETIIGGVFGLVAAVGLGVALYRGSLKLDLGKFFLVTGLLVIALAAYLTFGALHEFGEAGGGEALEVAGPVLALGFAAVCSWFYLRGPRPAATAQDAPTPASP